MLANFCEICLYSSLHSCKIFIHFITSSFNNIKIMHLYLCTALFLHSVWENTDESMLVMDHLLWYCNGEQQSYFSKTHSNMPHTCTHTIEVEQSLAGCVLCNNVCCSLFPVPSLLLVWLLLVFSAGELCGAFLSETMSSFMCTCKSTLNSCTTGMTVVLYSHLSL